MHQRRLSLPFDDEGDRQRRNREREKQREEREGKVKEIANLTTFSRGIKRLNSGGEKSFLSSSESTFVPLILLWFSSLWFHERSCIMQSLMVFVLFIYYTFSHSLFSIRVLLSRNLCYHPYFYFLSKKRRQESQNDRPREDRNRNSRNTSWNVLFLVLLTSFEQHTLFHIFDKFWSTHFLQREVVYCLSKPPPLLTFKKQIFLSASLFLPHNSSRLSVWLLWTREKSRSVKCLIPPMIVH